MSYIAIRRQEEKERRRAEILDAAEIVFARTGVVAAKMEDVARTARVSRALLYVYFPDKESLHFAISERALQLLRDRFTEAAARHHTGLDQIIAIGRSYLAFSQEFPMYFAALSSFESHTPEQIKADSVEQSCVFAGDEVHAVTARAVTLGVQDGSIRADVGNPHLIAVTLWGFLHGIIQLAQTKANLLAHDGISQQQLLSKAMEMCCVAIAGAKANHLST
jgi:TetR/AcrR family transcriptional regulator